MGMILWQLTIGLMLTSENTIGNTLAHAAEDGFDVVAF